MFHFDARGVRNLACLRSVASVDFVFKSSLLPITHAFFAPNDFHARVTYGTPLIAETITVV